MGAEAVDRIEWQYHAIAPAPDSAVFQRSRFTPAMG
jgi:hypothetical protein